jgi:hypothetical protein
MYNNKQFVLYFTTPDTKPGKLKKITCNALGEPVDGQDPANWLDYATAHSLAGALGFGIGFVFTEQDPYFFIDLDNEDLLADLLARFPGAFVERSTSGTGWHIIGRYSCPLPPHRTRPVSASVVLELYSARRFVALTWQDSTGNPDTDHSAALLGLIAQHFTPDAAADAAEWTNEPVAEWSGPTDDQELIDRMLGSNSAANAFGGDASLHALWAGQGTGDASRDDAKLCQHLAFWTGKDCERMDRLFRQSGLMRDKWERDDYRERTILGAVARCQRVLGAGVTIDQPPPPVAAPEIREGLQMMVPSQQVNYFAGCVYIASRHAVLTPNGEMEKPEQFRVRYGGYQFVMDAANRTMATNAWQAFTESQVVRYPMADRDVFRPDLAFQQIVQEDGLRLVNTYKPIDVPRAKGDAAPFLRHLSLLLPNQRDRDILLAYMAAVVQHKGVKFQWCPLIQGVEGNGKTFFTRCVRMAIGRRYTMMPQAQDIANKFNDWLEGVIFVGVEDIYVPAEKMEVLEILKPMITGGDGLGIQGKGTKQVTRDICANFMLNSNHKDALRKTENDRRFAVFYTAQQHVADLQRDGMDPAYMKALYDWAKSGGYAIVTDYLATYPIPYELNPATGAQRAPQTSSHAEAVSASRGSVEQEIVEAVEEGRHGFRGGFVSSQALSQLLDHMRKHIPQSRRRELMEQNGYILHPALPQGRATIEIDGARPRLYVKKDHLAAQLTDPRAVCQQYINAQQIAPQLNAASA